MIKTISAEIATGEEPGAGTDGEVFLGVGGREFCLSLPLYDDFEEGDEATYVFGEGSNVEHPEMNDPRSQRAITLDDVTRCPVYVRFQPHGARDAWMMQGVRVKVMDSGGQTLEFSIPQGDYLWLGTRSGCICHLRRTE